MATENETRKASKAPLLPSSRLLLGLMLMIAIMFLYLLRVILSMAMICMNKKPPPANCTALLLLNTTSTLPMQCNDTWIGLQSTTEASELQTTAPDKGEFEWSRQFQGTIISSYFYGYGLTQILGGYLSGKYGAKHVLGTGILVAVVLTFLTPEATRLSPYLLIAIRVLLGAAGGVYLPSSQAFWGRWAPVLERSILVSISFLGITLGNVMAYLLTPPTCGIEVDNGWPWVFYITGSMGVVYYILYNLLVFSAPDQHPRIAKRELTYITDSLGSGTIAQRPPVPWLKLFTSLPVWAVLVAQTCNTWFLFTAITLPFYMDDVLKFKIRENGLFLCIPYMIDMVTMPSSGQLADFLRRKKIFSTLTVRRIFQSISCLGSATLLIILSFIGEDQKYSAVAVLSMIYPIQNLCRAGYGVNPQDIAPRFAGEIFGITTTAGTISGIISPAVVGALTYNKTREDWQKVFFISAAVFIFGGTFFFIFAKGDIQPWAVTDKTPAESPLIQNDEKEKKKLEENHEDEKLAENGSARV